jgi:hypothetical protein
LTYTLIIDVSDPPAPEKGQIDLPDSIFDASCVDLSRLSTTDHNWEDTDYLEDYNNLFGIHLTTASSVSDPAIAVRTQKSLDSETVTIDSASGKSFQIQVDYAIKDSGTVNNGIVEGQAGDSIHLMWRHPRDGRDSAYALIIIRRTDIRFTDENNNSINRISNFIDNRFTIEVTDNIIKDSLLLLLTSSDGDTLSLWIKEAASQKFIETVTFQFSEYPDRNNRIIEGKFDSTVSSNSTVFTAWFNTKTSDLTADAEYVPVEKAWIIDGTVDGRADSVFIRFRNPVSGLPRFVSDICWPDNSCEAKKAHISSDYNSITFLDSQRSLIVVDLSKDQFLFGRTCASFDDPPTLTLPNGRKPVIQDSVKPILTYALKRPSDFKRSMKVMGTDSTLVFLPDTLFIAISERIQATATSVNPWRDLLLANRRGERLPVYVLEKPVPYSNDSLTWKLLVDIEQTPDIIRKGDFVSFNPSAEYVDGNANSLSDYEVVIDGRDGTSNNISIITRSVISGHAEYNGTVSVNNSIPIINEQGIQIGDLPEPEIEYWAPPYCMTGEGSVDGHCQASCMHGDDNAYKVLFPEDCISSITVFTEKNDGPYTCYIQIYDNLGNFVYASTQRFGYCGELNNRERQTQNGLIINDIIWNQKDAQGRPVGNGVFVWQIRIQFEKKSTRILKRTGIIRKNPILYNSCLTGL